MIRDNIEQAYFEWMCDLVCDRRYANQITYEKLLRFLHDTEFVYFIPKDENRAEDGIDLRYRFAIHHDYEDIDYCLDGPCSVLEMMVALAIRCEESIMDDPGRGDRTGQWFWGMVSNLGLGSMIDSRFDRQYVEEVVDRFLNRDYEPNGKGGLFTVRHCNRDLRTVEIWYQLCWYLDNIV
jgi:hypothetical protein